MADLVILAGTKAWLQRQKSSQGILAYNRNYPSDYIVLLPVHKTTNYPTKAPYWHYASGHLQPWLPLRFDLIYLNLNTENFALLRHYYQQLPANCLCYERLKAPQSLIITDQPHLLTQISQLLQLKVEQLQATKLSYQQDH